MVCYDCIYYNTDEGDSPDENPASALSLVSYNSKNLQKVEGDLWFLDVDNLEDEITLVGDFRDWNETDVYGLSKNQTKIQAIRRTIDILFTSDWNY